MKNYEFDSLKETILEEHRQVLASISYEDIEPFMEEIVKAKRIFIMGVGREGISARAFAMRLMHLGKEVHWIWDDTTPGMHKGDLFIAVNGSGNIGHITYVVQQAKKTGCRIVVVTGGPNEACAMLADYVVFLPAAVFNGTDERSIPSIQPMGNLFEQSELLLFDIIVILLEKKMKTSHKELEMRHRNVE